MTERPDPRAQRDHGPAKARRKRRFSSPLLLAALVFGFAQPAAAQQNTPAQTGATLFQNVRVFDGKSAVLSPPSNVLVRGNLIERVSASSVPADANTRVIDGGGGF
ncbi:hypothetical protein [Sphingomonas daechungensis]|uniref:hypothetical protein n=1 Tax=Sphingomonas daechungensis TaxID=1176646 RepID=UPI001CB94950|nr:hypothetical protein [Sphingomonas daechungensis]